VLKRKEHIPDDHHVMRHVGSSKLERDEDGNVIGFYPAAFELRPDVDVKGDLSVNWLEYFAKPHHAALFSSSRSATGMA
jgi:hypothetical protein